MAEVREKAAPVRIEEMKETRPFQKKEINQKSVSYETLEKELVSLEEQIIELDKRLLELEDLEVLQQLFSEKEKLEQRWEELCNLIEKNVGKVPAFRCLICFEKTPESSR